MLKPSTVYSLALALTLALTLSVSLADRAAFATKLTAPPLPHERDVKDFNDNDDSETIIPETGTRFNRRHNYKEDDKQKKEADEKAKKDAADNAKKAQDQRVDAYKKQLDTAIEANNQAVAFGKQGRWEEAITAHEKAVQYDPRNKQFQINLSAARTTLGQQRLAKGDLTAAASLFRKALAAAPDNGLAGKSLVQTLKKLGYDPNSADVRITLGDQLAAAGDMQSASIEYTAAMQLDPSARTYIKMGDMAYRYQQVGQALNWYRQAIVKDPENSEAHRQLGFLEMAQRDYTSAAASLRKAVILNPKDVAAGQALVDMWRKQVATNPLLAENHLGLAGAMQLTGDFVGADSEYRKLEALDPKNPGLPSGRVSLTHAIQHAKAEKHKLAAETLFNQGLRREALEEISQAVTLEQHNANYQYLLGECLEASGDMQGAYQAYLTCVLIDPENNKEAAARIRMMQSHGSVNSSQSGQMATSVANRLSGHYAQQSAVQAPAAPQTMAAPNMQSQSSMQSGQNSSYGGTGDTGYRKNMYEGGSSQGNMPSAGQLNFRTHEDEPAQTTPAAPAAPQSSQALSPALNDGMAKVTDAEAQRDYQSAVGLLRDMSSSNLQNPEIHHRLAVNLLASGQISEAISEFRIASCLSPTKKAYSDDLAQALAINKKSLTSDANGANGATGAIK